MLTKRKLNSIETLMSQALIDLDIIHEEFKIIVNEKEKYEQMIGIQEHMNIYFFSFMRPCSKSASCNRIPQLFL